MLQKRGTVTSAKMQKTVVVTIHRHRVHALYKKRYRVSNSFMADVGTFDPREGDEVLIEECRPLSKNKRFIVKEILKRAAQVSQLQEEAGLASVIQRTKVAPQMSSESSESSVSSLPVVAPAGAKSGESSPS